MESFWNSPDKVDLIRFVAQWLAVVSTIIALIFAMRFSTLKNNADLEKKAADAAQQSLLENKIQTAKMELNLTKNELKDTKTKLSERITEAEEAAKPRPLTERLRTILISIDPKIILALKQGNTKFSGGISATQFNDLQKIAKESDAKKYITVSPDVRMGIGMGPEGVTYGVDFTLNPQLLKD